MAEMESAPSLYQISVVVYLFTHHREHKEFLISGRVKKEAHRLS
jgi:hypothetical protein